MLPHHGAGTKKAWKRVPPWLPGGRGHTHHAWKLALPYCHVMALGHGWLQKLCCHEVVLGHSMGRYRCFCVIRRQYWILKAFRQVSKLHHRAALRDGTKVSTCGSPATWHLHISTSVTRPDPDTICQHWDTAGAGTDRHACLCGVALGKGRHSNKQAFSP